ncbi:unnamed protein product, partial [Sphacelaria rigidula]
PCAPRSESRVRRFAVPNITDTRADTRAGRFFIEIAGPFADTSPFGSHYVMLFVDDYSCFKIIRFLKKKDNTTAVLEDIVATHMAPAGVKIGIIRTDDGGEHHESFKTSTTSWAPSVRTPSHIPQYNRVAERALGLLRDKTVALLCSLKERKSDRLWVDVMQYACGMTNKNVTSLLGRGLTAYELWYGQKPSFTEILPSGTIGYLRRHDPPHKLAPPPARDGPTAAKPGERYKHAPERRSFTPTTLNTIAEYPSRKEAELESGISEQEDEERRNKATTTPTTAAARKSASYHTDETPAFLPRRTRVGGLIALLSSAMKAHTENMETRELEDVMVKEAAVIVALPSEIPEERTRLRQAQSSPECIQWRKALQREIEEQPFRGIWETVDHPEGRTILGTRLVFKRKIIKDGQIEKYTCQCFAQGFRQIPGIHSQEAPLPHRRSPASDGTCAHGLQLDVNMAYLEADVEEEIYIGLPDGYRQFKNQGGRLNKAMYGLVHAGLLWSKKFRQEELRKGFEKSQADPCVYRKKREGGVAVIIVVYVDDLLLVSATKEDEERALADLQLRFSIKDLRETSYYLGCHVSRDRKLRAVTLDQRQDAKKVIERFKIVKTYKIPVATGVAALSKTDGSENRDEVKEMRGIPYREAVGVLIWIAATTRPDLSFAAHNVAKFSENPGPAHWEAVMKVMQYLKNTKDCRIVYGETSRSDTKFSAWVDPDHSMCPDTRRSVSGAAFILAGGAISWFSRVQKLTASTSSESGYITLAEPTNELRFLRQVKYFMAPPADTGIPRQEGNQGAIKMSSNRFSSRRTRHIDVKHHVVRDAVDSGIVRVEYMNPGEQHADVLTKEL